MSEPRTRDAIVTEADEADRNHGGPGADAALDGVVEILAFAEV